MDFKQQINISAFPNPFSFRGRMRVGGMWCWGILSFVLIVIILKADSHGNTSSWVNWFQIIPIWLLWAAAVRRLHDHGLSGNWLFFLFPFGIALIFMAYVLELDLSVDHVVERIHKTGVFGWLFAAIAWFFVSVIVLFCVLFLCVGKNEENMFGPSPYPPIE